MTLWERRGHIWIILVALTCLVAFGAAPAAAVDGVLACGGSNTWLSGGDEGNRSYTVYRLDNFNNAGTILIEQILVYNGTGEVLCAFPGDWVPDSFKYVLELHQHTVTTTFNFITAGCLPPPSPANEVRGISLLVYWSFETKGDEIPLYATHADVYQDLNTGTYLNHMGRGSLDCKTVKAKKK